MNIKEEIKNKVIELLEAGTSEGARKGWQTRGHTGVIKQRELSRRGGKLGPRGDKTFNQWVTKVKVKKSSQSDTLAKRGERTMALFKGLRKSPTKQRTSFLFGRGI